MHLPRPLVDVRWLRDHLGEPGLVVADVRWINGGTAEQVRDAFGAGHIPGAVLLDVDRDLAGPPGSLGRHPLPDPAVFAATMGRAGIGGSVQVVAYDDAGGSIAARLWWMLDVLGLPVSVLDGGLGSWNGPLETGGPTAPPPPTVFAATSWPGEAVVDLDELVEILRRRESAVVDARAGERYTGDAEPIDPVAGHIPGAASAPWSENLDPDTGRFLPAEELRRRYGALGAGAGAVAYCGSGVTACHDLLAMRVAGIGGARLFEASWSGWIRDPARAVAIGREPGEPA
jgi:thiosulfate/3-mercaptopyruvate sulfurtransferase